MGFRDLVTFQATSFEGLERVRIDALVVACVEGEIAGVDAPSGCACRCWSLAAAPRRCDATSTCCWAGRLRRAARSAGYLRGAARPVAWSVGDARECLREVSFVVRREGSVEHDEAHGGGGPGLRQGGEHGVHGELDSDLWRVAVDAGAHRR